VEDSTKSQGDGGEYRRCRYQDQSLSFHVCSFSRGRGGACRLGQAPLSVDYGTS
jgi:hypothetical protein